MRTIYVVAALLMAGVAAPALAANADQPYQNIDKGNDAGNDTGNAQVDKLNRGQLDENQGGGTKAPAGSTVIVPTAPAAPR